LMLRGGLQFVDPRHHFVHRVWLEQILHTDHFSLGLYLAICELSCMIASAASRRSAIRLGKASTVI
jgi:hypothetical protein